MRRLIQISIPIIAILGTISAVTAFPFNRSWHMPATGVAGTNRAGAEGLYGTGGQQDKGIKCSHCHIDAAGEIDVSLTVTPPFGQMQGEDAYVPGASYTITVNLLGEHLSVGQMNNKNLMALAIEDASGQRAGRFISDAGQDSNACPVNDPYAGVQSPPGATTFMYGDCHGVLALDHPQRTSWTFDWTAPAAGAGDLTVFVGAVDGDTSGNSSLDDDVIERAIPLREGS